MRPLALLAAGLVFSGCGSASEQAASPAAGGRSLSAYGLSIELPRGWSGRILLGEERRPVLHASSIPLPSNDTDTGQIAREAMGELYLNVRHLGPGGSGGALPVRFSRSDFESSDHSRLREAHSDVVVSGERYRVTAVLRQGSEHFLERANSVLSSLVIEPYAPAAPPPAAGGEEIAGYGIRMRLPSGWEGRVTRGALEADSSTTLGPGDIRLRLKEHGGSDLSFLTGRFPVELSEAEFVGPGGGSNPKIPASAGRSFAVNGREFVLWAQAGALPPSSDAVAEANQALASLRVEGGDFYPGSVEPATFAVAPGWHTGTSGRAAAEPEGQQTWTYASTVPYRDEALQSPPYRTLERMPPDGIVILLFLFGPDVLDASRTAEPPFQLTRADHSGAWEGQIRDLARYTVAGRVPGQSYGVNISVYFGRARPTANQLAMANAELTRLTLPDWSNT